MYGQHTQDSSFHDNGVKGGRGGKTRDADSDGVGRREEKTAAGDGKGKAQEERQEIKKRKLIWRQREKPEKEGKEEEGAVGNGGGVQGRHVPHRTYFCIGNAVDDH